jgi:4'-phosphopantetheinyl transferase
MRWENPSAGSALTIDRDRVDVWRVAFEDWLAQTDRLERLLSNDEVLRADRFYRLADRQRFVIGRGLLRTLLGSYLAASPVELRFDYGPRGKPELAPQHASSALRFSLSHSGGLALYAVAQARAVGVDVERIDARVEYEKISSWLFSAEEHRAILALPEAARRAAFYACWTRKEAYVKATGLGFAESLKEFEVSVQPDQPAALLHVGGDVAAGRQWSLRNLEPAPGYAGAVVAAGRDWTLNCRSWASRHQVGEG